MLEDEGDTKGRSQGEEREARRETTRHYDYRTRILSVGLYRDRKYRVLINMDPGLVLKPLKMDLGLFVVGCAG